MLTKLSPMTLCLASSIMHTTCSLALLPINSRRIGAALSAAFACLLSTVIVRSLTTLNSQTDLLTFVMCFPLLLRPVRQLRQMLAAPVKLVGFRDRFGTIFRRLPKVLKTLAAKDDFI